MRKLVLLGLVITLASGCGRGWLPMFRGARCNSGICGVGATALPAAYDAGCANCGHAAGYEGYNSGEVIGGESSGGVSSADSYYGSDVIQGGIIDGGIVNGGVIDGGIVSGSVPYSGSGAITNPPSMQQVPLPAGK